VPDVRASQEKKRFEAPSSPSLESRKERREGKGCGNGASQPVRVWAGCTGTRGGTRPRRPGEVPAGSPATGPRIDVTAPSECVPPSALPSGRPGGDLHLEGSREYRGTLPPQLAARQPEFPAPANSSPRDQNPQAATTTLTLPCHPGLGAIEPSPARPQPSASARAMDARIERRVPSLSSTTTTHHQTPGARHQRTAAFRRLLFWTAVPRQGAPVWTRPLRPSI